MHKCCKATAARGREQRRAARSSSVELNGFLSLLFQEALEELVIALCGKHEYVKDDLGQHAAPCSLKLKEACHRLLVEWHVREQISGAPQLAPLWNEDFSLQHSVERG
ncbi:hypothetical protein ERJ75_000866200 [Trypanosoma vivax]|nr:hypothetical protein ERJ75_000866200 [Trypanosoma vivax]